MLRLLEGHSLTTRALLYPESMGLTLTERDSSAAPTFSLDAPSLQVNDWLQDMDEPGAGIVWRVKAIDLQYSTETVTCSLEHLIQSLGDRALGEVKTKDIAGGSTCTARQAAEYILAQQSDWALGDFDFDGVRNPYHFNGETLKAALEAVTGSLDGPVWEYDFTVYPFLLHIRQQDQTAGSEMRAGRNLTTLKYTIDKTRMFTRFYPIGKNNLKPSPEYVSKNEGFFGRVDKKETDQSKTTAAELIAWANERLSRHAEPLVTVTISGLDLSDATGESLDKLTVCHLCRIPLPEYGATILEKVTKLNWRDKIKDRESVTATLANALADVQSIIQEEKAKGGGAARTAAALNEENVILIGNVESGLYTRITQTASELRREAHDEAESLRSIISQTAESIRQTVEDDVDSLRSEITQTAESIRAEVTNEAASLRSEITQTAESIRAEVTNEAASLRSEITQTAESIRAEVSDEAASLRSAIQAEAGRISLIVEGYGASATVKRASIVAAINSGGESAVTISADQINLEGYVKATDITSDYINGKIASISVVTINRLLVTSTINASGYIYAQNFVLGSDSSGGGSNQYLTNAIKELSLTLSGDTYTLKKKSFGDSGFVDVGSFSRATALTGAWSGGGKFTVTASPQGETLERNLTTGEKENEDGTAYTSGNVWYVPIKAYWGPTPPTYENTGLRVRVDAGSIWTAGFNAGAPTGATLGSKVTGTVWNVSIQRGSYTAVGKTMDLSAAYADARSGYYTQAQYDAALATVPSGYFNSADVTFDCTDLGSSAEGNDKAITATAQNGSTQLGSASQVIHMGTGSWSGGRIGVTARLTNSSGKCVCRVYVSMPNSGTWSKTYLGTGNQYQIKHTIGGKEYTTTMSF